MITFKDYIFQFKFLSLFLFLYLLNPFNMGLWLGYAIIGTSVLTKGFLKPNLDFDFFILVFFSIIYALFYAFNPVGGNQFILMYSFLPPTFYILGKFYGSKVNSEKVAFLFLFFIGFILSLTALISVLINLMELGFGQIDRSLPMFWSNRIISATIMGSFFTLNMCIPALLISFPKRISLFFKIGVALIFVLSLLCILRIGTRTQIVISLFTLLSSLVFIIPRQSPRKNLVTFLLFALGVAIILKNVTFDLSSDWLSAFAGRMENNGGADIASGGGRTERWVKSFQYIFEKPLGWSIEEFGHSHNLWFDVLRVSGILPFILLMIFTARSFIRTKKAVAINNNLIAFNNQIRSYILAFFLIFMVEPIFEGMFAIFAVFCLITGYINKYAETHFGLPKHNAKE